MLIWCLENLFNTTELSIPPRAQTLRAIALVKKAIRATQQAKLFREEIMFFPIVDFRDLESSNHGGDNFERAEEALGKTLFGLETFKKWAYANGKILRSSDNRSLEMLNSFFVAYLKKPFKVAAIAKHTFEKQNPKDSYRATLLKLTTNAMNAMGVTISEDSIRKRLKDSPPVDPIIFKQLNSLAFCKI